MKRLKAGMLARRSSTIGQVDTSRDTPETNAEKSVKLFCESAYPANAQAEGAIHLPAIVDAAESSPAAAATAAYHIRKYIAHDIFTLPFRNYNAIMLMRILIDHPGPTFTKNINDKFVDAVKALLRTSRDPSVQQIARETLMALESGDKKDDPNLAKLLKMWKKEQTADVGSRINIANRSAAYLDVQNQSRSHSRPRNTLPSPTELSDRVTEARTTAKLLMQLTEETPVSSFNDNEILKEFAGRASVAQRSMQSFLECTDPVPDEQTFQTLIETCEQLSLANSKYQRGNLAALKARNTAVQQGSQRATPLEDNNNSVPQTQTQTEYPGFAPTNGINKGKGVVGRPTLDPFADENSAHLDDLSSYYAAPKTGAVELAGDAGPEELEDAGPSRMFKDDDEEHIAAPPVLNFRPPQGPPPGKTLLLDNKPIASSAHAPVGLPPVKQNFTDTNNVTTRSDSVRKPTDVKVSNFDDNDVFSSVSAIDPQSVHSAGSAVVYQAYRAPASSTARAVPAEKSLPDVSVSPVQDEETVPKTHLSHVSAIKMPQDANVDGAFQFGLPDGTQEKSLASGKTHARQWGEDEAPESSRHGGPRIKNDEPMTPLAVSGSGWHY